MFAILADIGALLFLKIFGSQEDQQQIAKCLRENSECLQQIHVSYRALNARSVAFVDSATREADKIFSQMFSEYRDELNKQMALRDLPRG